jgi:hypothetical protein
MKRLAGNATADSLTCDVREADANSLNSLEQSGLSSRSNYSKSNPIATLFLSRTRLQSCRKCHRINVGFSPCGVDCFILARTTEFFRSLFSTCGTHPGPEAQCVECPSSLLLVANKIVTTNTTTMTATTKNGEVMLMAQAPLR